MVLRALSDMFSNLPGWIYPKQMYFINSSLFSCDSVSRSSSFCYRIVVRETENRQLLHSFLVQLPKPLLQEFSLWLMLGQRQRFLIRGPGLSYPAEPAAHICTRRMRQVIIRQFAM